MSRRAFLAGTWTLVILFLCWLPRFYMPVKEHGPPPFRIPNVDKLVHLGIFAVWGFLWMGVARSPHQARRVFLAGVGFTILTEVVQELPMVSRDANLFDGIADTIGIGVGIGLDSLVRRHLASDEVVPERQEI